MPTDSKYLEDAFALWLRHEGIKGYVQQYRFVDDRRFRFDFAWPPEKVAVEIDGLKYDGRGGHQTVKGRLADAEKYMAAQRMGWQILTVPGQWVAEQERGGNVRMIWEPTVMDTLRKLLEG